jgi:glycosyltransferase involved in cell wall biosynthesis
VHEGQDSRVISTTPRHSLIIPAHNEEACLPRLLDTVDRARERYSAGAALIEVIVADNASTDRTAQIARARGCGVVVVQKRVIAAARNGGARAARGAILTFVDADSQVHPDTFDEVERALAGDVVGGATGIRFERSSIGLACTYGLLVLLGGAVRLVFGERPARQVDAGVVFCRRSDFEEIGGYNEERLFGEDVQFLLDLSKLGGKRGQRLARGTKARAVVSTRKFDSYGDWHYFTAPFRLPWSALCRPSATNDFAQRYWYERR